MSEILINCIRNYTGRKRKKRIKNILKNSKDPSKSLTLRRAIISTYLNNFPESLILYIYIFRIHNIVEHVLKDCDFITIDRKKEIGNLKVEKLYRPAAPM